MSTQLETLLQAMLTENTGIHMMDSGGENGRQWQRNAGKTVQDFKNEPSVTFDRDGVTSSKELSYTISAFHFLNATLDLDELCNKFNDLKMDNWDSEIYGVSAKGAKLIEKMGFTVKDSFNTYNGESSLSTVLQGTRLEHENGIDEYVLLQIHGGADVRGGYTDAKLFHIKDVDQFLLEDVYGSIGDVMIDNRYNGVSLTDEDGNDVEITQTSTIELFLPNE